MSSTLNQQNAATMKKQIRKSRPILIVDQILDCLPEDFDALEAYFSEGEIEEISVKEAA